MDNNLQAKIKKIKLLLTDVDGVLTDGKIVVSDSGCESKNFDVRDGHGIRLLIRSGIDVIILTGRASALLKIRTNDLGISEIHQGVWNKLTCFEEIANRRGIAFDEVCFIGDDIVDVPLLRRVGVSFAPANAVDEVKKVVSHVTAKDGGNGAVREVCEMILKGNGSWQNIIAHYELGH
ncbi:MAG: HAD hydrolase family protein [Deltaproteobacteria bacterium]